MHIMNRWIYRKYVYTANNIYADRSSDMTMSMTIVISMQIYIYFFSKLFVESRG